MNLKHLRRDQRGQAFDARDDKRLERLLVHAVGSVNQNVAPWPRLLSTPTRPPCC